MKYQLISAIVAKWEILVNLFFPLGFPVLAALIGLRNGTLFEAPRLIQQAPWPWLLLFLLLTLWLKRSPKQSNFLAALLLVAFTTGFFFLASILNKQYLNTNNVYFEADSRSWYWRMALPIGWTIGTRPIHFLAHFIFRPPIALLSLLTGGDRFYSTLLLLSLAGGGSIVLLFFILRELNFSPPQALSFSSLLGFSTSHLIFSSVIETYIFSACLLLIFIMILLKNRHFLYQFLVAALTMGITVPNVLQNLFVHLSLHRNLRKTLLFGSLIFAFGVLGNTITYSMKLVTGYFFDPTYIIKEKKGFAEPITLKRAQLMAENLFLYNIIAPHPYFYIRHKTKPRFNFIQESILEYFKFGKIGIKIWIVILGLTLVSLPRTLAHPDKYKALTVALLASLALNFLLHIGYGSEPFLYTADWTYALVLLVAINLRYFLSYTWVKVLLLLFLAMQFFNQLWVFYLITAFARPFLQP